MEIEELEMDLDECESQRMRFHCHRVDEIYTEQQVRAIWRSRVRRQAQRWGVRNMDLRKSVIRRHLGKNEKRNPTGARLFEFHLVSGQQETSRDVTAMAQG